MYVAMFGKVQDASVIRLTHHTHTHTCTHTHTHTHTQGHIYVNGMSLSKMRNWFVQNTGYVRQLATSFYSELTVRENLLFSMNMQAYQGMKLQQKLERVEQVIREVCTCV